MMTTHKDRRYKTGGDPRTLADFIALRAEMNKLSHPARPDINWPYAEQLARALLEHHGADLQTVAWYTLARARLDGLAGINEGLSLLETLLAHQGKNLWPQALPARTEIFRTLSKRLRQVIRTLNLTPDDLASLSQAECSLQTFDAVLQRLEIAPENPLSDLRALLRSTATRFENLDPAPAPPATPPVAMSEAALPDALVSEEDAAKAEPAPERQRRPEAEPLAPSSPAKRPAPGMASTPVAASRWKPFIAGMVTMLAVSGIAVGGWLALRQTDLPPTVMTQQAGPLADLPGASPHAPVDLRQAQRQLDDLARLAPDWAISYGDRLVQLALSRWPEQAKPLAQQWQRQLSAAALPAENLTGWAEGMRQLQRLAGQLNALDEQKGKYLTVSELKTAVFAIMQSLNRAVPLEEQLRELAALPAGQPWPAARGSLAELHLQQLIVEYALLKRKQPAPPPAARPATGGPSVSEAVK
ncbi:VasL domain-containing protein [Klebsiella sp. JB_Kp004]|uniref:VasL domain-containing protein n=1 Tax=Klebsiella sp. JB_Kp004 TaxID=3153357 RepID=UPI0032B5A6DA|nr:type VI secretion system ImpA family N-terminal domain-containing protein [Klebsiella quasipneumoniae subsp. quasipneumoniae]